MLSNVPAKRHLNVRSNRTDRDDDARPCSVLTRPANLPKAVPLSVAMVKRAWTTLRCASCAGMRHCLGLTESRVGVDAIMCIEIGDGFSPTETLDAEHPRTAPKRGQGP